MISGIPIDILFIVSVLLIWFMLMYQFVLTFAGYLYSRDAAKEKKVLDRRRLDLPNVSILIPAHNEEIVIERTLEALFKSEYPPDRLEVIVLDDGSTDKTPEILQ